MVGIARSPVICHEVFLLRSAQHCRGSRPMGPLFKWAHVGPWGTWGSMGQLGQIGPYEFIWAHMDPWDPVVVLLYFCFCYGFQQIVLMTGHHILKRTGMRALWILSGGRGWQSLTFHQEDEGPLLLRDGVLTSVKSRSGLWYDFV